MILRPVDTTLAHVRQSNSVWLTIRFSGGAHDANSVELDPTFGTKDYLDPETLLSTNAPTGNDATDMGPRAGMIGPEVAGYALQ